MSRGVSGRLCRPGVVSGWLSPFLIARASCRVARIVPFRFSLRDVQMFSL